MVPWPVGTTRPARWPRIRYSIRGLLVFMFGLAVGLSTARSGQANWSELLLATFAGWFMVGMAEMAWDAVQGWHAAPADLPRDVRLGMFLEILWPLGVIAMVIAATGMDQFSRSLMASESTDLNTHVAIPGLVQATLMLAVICGYWRESSRTPADGKWGRWNPIFVAFVVCAGLFWVSLVVLNEMLLVPLIHVAIEGVRSAQPTRWGGQDFEPVRLLPGVFHDYVHLGLLGGALSAASFALACGIPRAKRTHWAIRIAMFVAWCGCIAVIAILLHWSYTVALPDLSPFLATRILTQPATNYAFGLVLILFASSWLAWRIAARPLGAMQLQPSEPPLHRRTSLMVFFLIAALWGSLSFWSVRDLLQSLVGLRGGWSIADLMQRLLTIVEVHLSEPSRMIRLVAMAVVAQQLWWRWRKKGDYKVVSYAVDATRFTIATVLLTLTGAVSVPAMAWYGVALYFWLAIE